ncbi:MAG: lipid-A-disaccharide synthase [Bacteroidales bacterium]|nr:lipid-A-disaccharide synthase [Bacteroidales bacterium]
MSRYYIIAGEASGDLHGSNLMKGIIAEDPGAEIRFWGGGMMASVGGTLVEDYREGAVIGFSQVLLHPRKFAARLARCISDITSWKPDVVILIDYPGFNFRVAEAVHKEGFKVFYYIAPKVWASRESRVKKLKAFVDKLFIVFPFEIPYFTSKGVDFVYKGNPLVDAIDNSEALSESRGGFLLRSGLPDKPMIALLAGSRTGEISSMMPTFMEFADRMHSLESYSDYLFVVAAAPARSEEDYSRYVGDRDYVKVVSGMTYSVMRNSRAAVVNSGTASLECALIGTPQVVAYRTATLNYMIARMIIKVKYISLGNLILNRTCFKELLQDYFTADNVLYEVRRLIEDDFYRDEMLNGYKEIRSSLGGSGASAAVARAMIEELNKQ